MRVHSSGPASEGHGERGSALVLALFFGIVTLGVVIAGALMLRANSSKTLTNFRVHSQATQFARAGLTEAMSWYRRQTNQPVLEFAPRIDMAATPPLLDTDDPAIGLAREFEIEGKIWGRYEVWKEWESDPDPERLAWRRQMQARDVSAERGVAGQGVVWRLRSIGYVFSREDASRRFDELPNRVVAVQILESEILRRRVAPPGQAAVTAAQGALVLVDVRGRIAGGAAGAGIYFPAGSGTPVVGPTSENRVTGTPALAPSSTPIDLSPEAVFGLTATELRAASDQVVVDRRDFPRPVPDFDTVYVAAPSITFDSSLPLSGTGIVYAEGDVSILAGSSSRFSGILYVDGDLLLEAPCEIEGAVIVTGSLTAVGAGDYATVRYDDAILNAMRQQVGQYRFIGSFRAVNQMQ